MTELTTKLTFNSFNARGLGEAKKRRSIFKWLKDLHKGVFLIQETHSQPSIEKVWEKEWGNTIIFSHGTSKSRGVAVLFSKQLDVCIHKTVTDVNGRYILLEMDIDNNPLVLMNIYAPTKDKPKEQAVFIEQIFDILQEYQDKNIILAGDFNTYLNPDKDKKGGKSEIQSTSSKYLCEYLDAYNLIDVWRVVNPDEYKYTWRNHTRNGFVQSRIDYFFTSTHMIYDLGHATIKPGIKSDHSLIELSFNIKKVSKGGRGFWKFNSSLLRDSNYTAKVKQILINDEKQYADLKDKSLLWDVIKCDIRAMTISYSSWIAKQKRKKLTELNEKLVKYENDLDNGLEVHNEYNSTKSELEKIIDEQAYGVYIRSRAKYIDENEKSNKYFLQQEIRNSKLKTINGLLVDENTLITKQDQILKEQKRFYETLYSKGNSCNCTDSCNFFSADIPKLNEIDRNLCDNLISIEECGKSLKNLPNNKAPGSDGFTTEFYKFFWLDIKKFVYDSFLYSFENGILSIDQRRAILTLLPKNGKDLRWLKNWRPLSLLNTDYKIIAKLLATRLQDVLPKLINEDQAAYIKNRYIGENIRKIIDIFEFTCNKFNPGIAIFLDFEKAFDTISWDFLHMTLDTFNFGPYFKNWVKILYNKPVCSVINNGISSETFEIKRGIRQGCPISALLFLLVAEIMAIHIRCDNNIKNININGCSPKIVQMADDTTIFVKDTASVKIVLDILNKFHQCAGLKLNTDKTEAIQLGINTNTIKSKFGIKWVEGPIKILGIWVGKNLHDVEAKNIHEKIKKVETVLNMWKSRTLSIKGKITLLKSQAMPILLYPLSVLFVEDDTLKHIDKLFFDFIWPKGKHHIKKNVLIQDIQNGGLKMPDIKAMTKSIKLTWIKRIISKDNTFSQLFSAVTNIEFPSEYLCSKLDAKHLQANIPAFYKDILIDWFHLYSTKPVTCTDVHRETIWHNKYILIEQKPIMYKNWKKAGILYIHDIINAQGKFISAMQLATQHNLNPNSLFLMQYNSLKSAIPKTWIKILKDNSPYEVPDNIPKIKINKLYKDITKLKCKDFYNVLIAKKEEKPTCNYKWEQIYENHSFNWENIYCLPYIVARETSLQSMQYRIINRYIPCRKNLFKWKKVENEKCPFCDQVDNIEHYFYECKQTKPLWRNLFDLWITVYQTNIPLTILDIIFGLENINEDPLIDFINFCILLMKKYIFDTKLAEKNCNFKSFINILKKRTEMEKYLHQIADNQANLNEHWETLLQYFTSPGTKE